MQFCATTKQLAKKTYNKAFFLTFIAASSFVLSAACQGVEHKTNGASIESENVSHQLSEPDSLAVLAAIEGNASYYADALHGRPTASGETYDSSAYTAAHMSLPFNTELEVHNLENNKRVRVRVNDRGPYHPERILDVSKAAAKELGMLDAGVVRIRARIVSTHE